MYRARILSLIFATSTTLRNQYGVSPTSTNDYKKNSPFAPEVHPVSRRSNSKISKCLKINSMKINENDIARNRHWSKAWLLKISYLLYTIFVLEFSWMGKLGGNLPKRNIPSPLNLTILRRPSLQIRQTRKSVRCATSRIIGLISSLWEKSGGEGGASCLLGCPVQVQSWSLRITFAWLLWKGC